MFMFILFIFDMEEEFNEFIGGIPALFMPGIEDIPFIWDRAPFIFTEDPKLFCISSCSCDFIIEPPIGGWQGFPSLTNTGTATLLGEGRGFKSSPFSCLARFSLYLWFWNQIFTCTGVSRIMLARCSLSGAERYLCVVISVPIHRSELWKTELAVFVFSDCLYFGRSFHLHFHCYHHTGRRCLFPISPMCSNYS